MQAIYKFFAFCVLGSKQSQKQAVQIGYFWWLSICLLAVSSKRKLFACYRLQTQGGQVIMEKGKILVLSVWYNQCLVQKNPNQVLQHESKCLCLATVMLIFKTSGDHVFNFSAIK